MSHFTLALSGLSDTDAAMFEAALDALPDHSWQLVDAPEAFLLIVDIDTVWGHMDWLRATANGKQVAAYTRDGNVRDCDLVLTKPLRANELSALLARLGDSVGATAPVRAENMPEPVAVEPAVVVEEEDAAAATETAAPPAGVDADDMPDTGTAPPQPAPAPAEPPPLMTLGECLLADKLGHPYSMQGADGIVLQLDPERGGYTGPSTLKPLKALLDTPMDEAEAMQPDAIDRMREAPALPLTRLLWFAALCASPGVLAPNLDRQARFHLTRWPQIEREFPRHFRIATTMMKGPGTLGDIASMANAPAGDVADFINAYSVAGYVACEGAGDSNGEAVTEGNNRMFSRLRRPFTRGGQQEAT